MLLDDNGKLAGTQTHQRAGGVDAQRAHQDREQGRVEVPGPRGHARDAVGRVPRRLVRSHRAERIVNITDRAHARHLRERVALQSVRVAGAVDTLVVVQADIHRHRAGAALDKQPVPQPRVGAHHVEFGVGQLAGLVQNVQRHHRLADIVKQAGHAGLAAGGGTQAELARQRDHERADRDRMHVGVVVFRLEARKADKRAGVAEHRLGQLLDQRLEFLGVHGLAQAQLTEELLHRILRLPAQARRLHDLVLERGARRRHRITDHCRLGVRQRRPDRVEASRCEGPGRCSPRDIEALGRVDPALAQPAATHRQHVSLFGDDEPGPPEGVRQPRAFERVQVHAQAQFGNVDFLEHG